MQPATGTPLERSNTLRTSATPTVLSFRIGFEQARHGFLHLVDQFVNDGVKLDLHAFVLGFVGHAAVDPRVEAEDHGIGRGRQGDIGFGDRADGAVDDFQGDLVGLDLLQGIDDGLDRSLGVGLDHHLQGLAAVRFQLREQVFQGDLGAVGLQARKPWRSWPRCSARSRAAFSSSTTLNSSPASGTPFKPRTLTATEGPASFRRLPSSLISARTRP